MFTEIDKILYPNRCEVIEFASQRFVFPIFKNGSSSLRKQASADRCRILLNQQIKKCDAIEVILRDPVDRMRSGMASFVGNLDADLNTVKMFVEKYAFLDRHYLPQINWLMWLGSYSGDDKILKLRGMDHLTTLTSLVENKSGHSLDWQIRYSAAYLELDQCLYSLIGQDIDLSSILMIMKEKHTTAYQHVFEHAKRLTNVLP